MRITTHFLGRLIFAISQIFPVNGNLFVSTVPKVLASRSEYPPNSKLPARVPEHRLDAEYQSTIRKSSEKEDEFLTEKILQQFNNAKGYSGGHVDTKFSAEVLKPNEEPYNTPFSNSELLKGVQEDRDFLDKKENISLYAFNTTGILGASKTASRPGVKPFLSSQLYQAEKSFQLTKNVTELYDRELAYTSSSSEVLETTRRPQTRQLFSSSHTWSEASAEVRNLRGKRVLSRYQDGNSYSMLEESLKRLLVKIVETYLQKCDLILITDRSYQESIILGQLAMSSNLKQVVFMEYPKDLSNTVVWNSARCQGTLILASDPEILYELGNENPLFWDYKAKVVLVGLTEEFLEDFTRTKIGRKTEHIVGVVKDDSREGHFRIYRNQLFWGDGMTLVTSWYPGRATWNKADLFPDKISNLRRGAIRVIVFEWQPAIIYHRDAEGNLLFRYGRDPAVVEALAEVFNFTVLYKDPPDGQTFGLKLPNGTFDGMVGLLGSDDGDIAIANLYMSAIDGRDQFQEYSAVFAEDKSCCMARVDPPLPRWQSPSLPFQMTTWIAILVGLLLAGPVLYVLAIASKKSGFAEPCYRYIIPSSLYTFGVHFSHPMRALPKGSAIKIFIAFLWVYSILLTTGYRSNLTAFLTVVRMPASIETFEDLYQSGLHVMGIPFFKTSLESSGNQYLRALADKFKVSLTFSETTKDVLEGKAVTINSRIYLEAVGAQLKRKGKPMVRIMKECFSSYAVGLAYPRNSPLKSKFDLWIGRIFDSGLVRRWLLNSITRYQQLQKEDTPMEEDLEQGDESAGGATPLTMDHMQGVFIVLGFGYAFSTIAFAVEMFA